MDVTNENFNEIYPEILEKIKECDFCSIDCELSGITNYKILNSFDTPRYRYEKIRKNDQSYLILQFGICFFKNLAENNSYETSAYNCYLFPRSQNCKYSTDSSFSCLNSSIEFLINQKFDFNKVFSQGISFMSKDNEEKIRSKIIKNNEEKKNPKGLIFPSNNKDNCEKIEKIMNEIEEFYLNVNETTKEIKFTEFLLRVYVEKNIKQKYLQIMKYEYKFLENKERLMTLTKIEKKEEKNDLDVLNEETGFSKVIWNLSQSQKLIVGHNMLTDIMQILRQFFSQLPENYEDFKSMTNSLFPNLLDTKYMASLAPLKELIHNTTLGDMDKILEKEPFPQLNLTYKENCSYNINNEKLHEAGYDAFLTGHCYLRMLNYLVSLNSSKQSLVEFYSNKIHLMRSFDITFIDLKSKQDEPKRDNVFYLEFPPSWETSNIYDLFSSFGSVFVAWIDDKSAFVALQNPDNIKKAAAQLVGVSGREYRVYFYNTYLKQLNKKNDFKIEIKKFDNQFKTKNGNSTDNNKHTESITEKRKITDDAANSKSGHDGENKSDCEQPIKIELSKSISITSEANQNLKKIKLESEQSFEKPFEECQDW